MTQQNGNRNEVACQRKSYHPVVTLTLTTMFTGNKDRSSEPTAPVSMSYMRVPKLHQSTAFPWPIRCRISGALYPQEKEGFHEQFIPRK